MFQSCHKVRERIYRGSARGIERLLFVYGLDMFSSNDVDELESHNDGKSKISYRHEPGRRIEFIWMSQYPMSSSAKIQQILRRYA